MIGDRPIQHDFTATEEALARAAYQAYHGSGPRVRWEALKSHERFRWMLVAAFALATSTTDPARIRAAYMVGIYVAAWEDTKVIHRQRWIRVRDALVAAQRREAA